MMAMDVNLLVYTTPNPRPIHPPRANPTPQRIESVDPTVPPRGPDPPRLLGSRATVAGTWSSSVGDARLCRRASSSSTCERGTETRTKEVLDLRRRKEES